MYQLFCLPKCIFVCKSHPIDLTLLVLFAHFCHNMSTPSQPRFLAKQLQTLIIYLITSYPTSYFIKPLYYSCKQANKQLILSQRLKLQGRENSNTLLNLNSDLNLKLPWLTIKGLVACKYV